MTSTTLHRSEQGSFAAVTVVAAAAAAAAAAASARRTVDGRCMCQLYGVYTYNTAVLVKCSLFE